MDVPWTRSGFPVEGEGEGSAPGPPVLTTPGPAVSAWRGFCARETQRLCSGCPGPSRSEPRGSPRPRIREQAVVGALVAMVIYVSAFLISSSEAGDQKHRGAARYPSSRASTAARHATDALPAGIKSKQKSAIASPQAVTV